jgi:hypothetical protein
MVDKDDHITLEFEEVLGTCSRKCLVVVKEDF